VSAPGTDTIKNHLAQLKGNKREIALKNI